MMPVRTLKDALPTGARTKTSFSSRKNSLPQSRVSCAKDSLHVLGFRVIERERDRERERPEFLTPLAPILHRVGMMPEGFDRPPCPGERESERPE